MPTDLQDPALVALVRGRAGLAVRPELLAPDWGLMRRILRIGVPGGVDALSVSICQLAFISIVNHLGKDDL